MTTTLKHYDMLVHTAGGRTRLLGQRGLRQPTEKTHDGDGRVLERDMVIEPGQLVLVWDGSAEGEIRDFASLTLRIIGSGTLNLYWVTDTVDGDGDYTGAAENVYPESMSCLLAMTKGTPDVETNPVDADILGLTAGEPTLAGDAGTVLGKYKKLWAKNPATATANVTARLEVTD